MDTTLSKHECGMGISPIFDTVFQYHVANFSYSIAVLGTPPPPQVPSWTTGLITAAPLLTMIALEFEFEISDLSSHFLTWHLADPSWLKSVVDPVLYCYRDHRFLVF